ncbi:zinc finger protein, putative [Plasmodium vivax]|uniref:Zinc finger protein, putative n=1 Tax=Plasmodium vivax TaxID=5855 RepID=A0A1G4HIT4_PLAVI|nr:zinc finger protein, putative [Plasmodium vivax]
MRQMEGERTNSTPSGRRDPGDEDERREGAKSEHGGIGGDYDGADNLMDAGGDADGDGGGGLSACVSAYVSCDTVDGSFGDPRVNENEGLSEAMKGAPNGALNGALNDVLKDVLKDVLSDNSDGHVDRHQGSSHQCRLECRQPTHSEDDPCGHRRHFLHRSIRRTTRKVEATKDAPHCSNNPKNELKKTSLCKYWLKGVCANVVCNFAHGEQELKYTYGVYKTTICKHWKRDGFCSSGINCRHAHGEGELQPKNLPLHLLRKKSHFKNGRYVGKCVGVLGEHCSQLIGGRGLGEHFSPITGGRALIEGRSLTGGRPLTGGRLLTGGAFGEGAGMPLRSGSRVGSKLRAHSIRRRSGAPPDYFICEAYLERQRSHHQNGGSATGRAPCTGEYTGRYVAHCGLRGSSGVQPCGPSNVLHHGPPALLPTLGRSENGERSASMWSYKRMRNCELLLKNEGRYFRERTLPEPFVSNERRDVNYVVSHFEDRRGRCDYGFGVTRNGFGEMQNGFGEMQNGFGMMKNQVSLMKNPFGEMQNGFSLMQNPRNVEQPEDHQNGDNPNDGFHQMRRSITQQNLLMSNVLDAQKRDFYKQHLLLEYLPRGSFGGEIENGLLGIDTLRRSSVHVSGGAAGVTLCDGRLLLGETGVHAPGEFPHRVQNFLSKEVHLCSDCMRCAVGWTPTLKSTQVEGLACGGGLPENQPPYESMNYVALYMDERKRVGNSFSYEARLAQVGRRSGAISGVSPVSGLSDICRVDRAADRLTRANPHPNRSSCGCGRVSPKRNCAMGDNVGSGDHMARGDNLEERLTECQLRLKSLRGELTRHTDMHSVRDRRVGREEAIQTNYRVTLKEKTADGGTSKRGNIKRNIIISSGNDLVLIDTGNIMYNYSQINNTNVLRTYGLSQSFGSFGRFGSFGNCRVGAQGGSRPNGGGAFPGVSYEEGAPKQAQRGGCLHSGRQPREEPPDELPDEPPNEPHKGKDEGEKENHLGATPMDGVSNRSKFLSVSEHMDYSVTGQVGDPFGGDCFVGDCSMGDCSMGEFSSLLSAPPSNRVTPPHPFLGSSTSVSGSHANELSPFGSRMHSAEEVHFGGAAQLDQAASPQTNHAASSLLDLAAPPPLEGASKHPHSKCENSVKPPNGFFTVYCRDAHKGESGTTAPTLVAAERKESAAREVHKLVSHSKRNTQVKDPPQVVTPPRCTIDQHNSLRDTHLVEGQIGSGTAVGRACERLGESAGKAADEPADGADPNGVHCKRGEDLNRFDGGVNYSDENEKRIDTYLECILNCGADEDICK